MKTLKSIFLGLALLIAGNSAFATNQNPLSKNDVLSIYVDALIHGKIGNVDAVLDKNVKHTVYRGEKQFKLDKKQIMESLKATENIEQGCTFNTQISEETDNSMVVKLTMKYETYTRVNTIIISSEKGDFKITKIETQA